MSLYEGERQRLGSHHHVRAKEEVCRHFGYGVLAPDLMQRSPETGVTLVGLGSVRKDQAQIFHMPLPPSLSGDRVPRSMRVTLAWFSPVDAARAPYRLAGLEAVAADEGDGQHDKKWRLELQSSSSAPDANMVRRGSVWSQRLIQRVNRVPTFADGGHIPICVQCRDTAGGALNPDEDIAFAIAVTLEVSTTYMRKLKSKYVFVCWAAHKDQASAYTLRQGIANASSGTEALTERGWRRAAGSH